MKKLEILKKATTTVEKRTDTNGYELAVHFNHVARLWSNYTGNDVTAADVAAMMVLLKLSRAKLGDSGAEDHYIDMAGYAAIMGELNSDKP